MGRYRFVDPELERIPISDGDWIEVDKEINFKDSNEIYKARRLDDRIRVLVLMLRGWSFTDHDGKPMEINEDTVSNLDQDTAAEVANALTLYYEKAAKEKKARKTSAKSVAR